MIPDETRTITDLEALRVYFDPLRKRIVQQFSGEPRSIHQVADALDIPFTRLYYHINLLEKHGLIRVVAIQQLQGAVEEKYYQVTAYHFVIDRALLNSGTPAAEAGLSLILDTVLERARENIERSVRAKIIDLSATAPDPKAMLVRRGGFLLTETQARWVYEHLLTFLHDLRLMPEDDGGEKHQYELSIACYPTVDPPETADPDPRTNEDKT